MSNWTDCLDEGREQELAGLAARRGAVRFELRCTRNAHTFPDERLFETILTRHSTLLSACRSERKHGPRHLNAWSRNIAIFGVDQDGVSRWLQPDAEDDAAIAT